MFHDFNTHNHIIIEKKPKFPTVLICTALPASQPPGVPQHRKLGSKWGVDLDKLHQPRW